MRIISVVSMASCIALAGNGAAAVGASAPKTVTGTVGPGFTITLKQAKKTVQVLAPGQYIFVVNDKSTIHNFHLTGPGVNRKTSVGGTGKSSWRLTLRKGTYRFVCDPHATTMKGRFVVQAP